MLPALKGTRKSTRCGSLLTRCPVVHITVASPQTAVGQRKFSTEVRCVVQPADQLPLDDLRVQLPALAAELVALKVDVIVAATGLLAALAAKQATRTLPIVFAGVGDPVESALVTSLARPGGNVTGLSFLAAELVGKRLELLTQAVPGVSRIAVLWQPGGHGERTEKDMLKGAEVAARALGVRLQFVEARGPADFDRAFSEMTRPPASALTVLSSTMFGNERKRLVDLAAKNRLPALYPWREAVDAGGLMSYGPNVADLVRRAATYVDISKHVGRVKSERIVA